MQITWDEPKRLANLEKHGLDFASVILFDWASAMIETGHSNRFRAIGRFQDGTAVVVFAALGTEAVSIISFRPASSKERKML